MIKSNSTINIDGTLLENEQIVKMFTYNRDDRFGRWVVRPATLLVGIGLITAVLLASIFLTALSLAMMPLLVIFYWAVKTKMERDLAASDVVVNTSEDTIKDRNEGSTADMQGTA